MMKALAFTDLADADLVAEVIRSAACERDATARLVALLAEFDARRLYLGEGCSSLFTYCTQLLHLSEHAAYNRIQAARAARRFPVVLERLAEGSIHLSAVRLLEPHMTLENYLDVLDAARHKTKRAVEELVARLHPRPDASSSTRRLSAPTAPQPARELIAEAAAVESTASSMPELPPRARSSIVTPLAPERYKVQFTVSKNTYDKLRRAQDLIRHRVPTGDLAVIFDQALTLLLSELERTKLAAARHPRHAVLTSSRSRHVPAAVKRAVWTRDEARCAFVGSHGRCTETGFLEFHHRVPYAAGGETVVENLELRCRAHNAYESELYFGRGQPLFARERDCAAWTCDELVPERVRRMGA